MQSHVVAAEPTAPHVLAFCATIAGGEPMRVEQAPQPDAVPLECFNNVRTQVSKDSGALVLGWAIWEWPGKFIEAEQHAVWERPDGTLLDPTPQEFGLRGMTFLRDPLAVDDGIQRDNHRHALCSDPVVGHFLLACRARSKFLNAGSRANQFGELRLSHDDAKMYDLIESTQAITQAMLTTGSNMHAECLCDSGRPYGLCHGLMSGVLAGYVGKQP
ncbi:hypothetical protein D9M68_184950 [compost metagenome]